MFDKNNYKEPSLKDIETTFRKISSYIKKTPVLTSDRINDLIKGELYFKCENLQMTGAFKVRGAINSVLNVNTENRNNGVATHSSGNHAAAISYSAKLLNIPAYIVMPSNSSPVKIKNVQFYGGEIIFCEPTQKAREETLAKVVEKTGATFIHPYNNLDVIIGQSTVGYELLQEIDKLDYIIVPIGGGGLSSGTCIATAHFSKETKVIGVEPENADDAIKSIETGIIHQNRNPDTIADGLKTSLGDITLKILTKYIKEIIIVTDKEIMDAMGIIWDYLKVIAEPSGAVTLAAVLKKKEFFENQRIGVVISGGNTDFRNIKWY